MAGRASTQGQTLKDQWIMHGSTNFLPDEIIPESFAAGESGASFGWPKEMMGQSTMKMLHSKGIISTSQCIQLAMNMTEAQFEGLCEGGRPSFAYFKRCMERPEIRREFDERWEKWQPKQYRTNNKILENKKYKDSNEQLYQPSMVQKEMVRMTIAKNKEKITDIPLAMYAVIAVFCLFLVRYLLGSSE
jgi:hypothetical protein